MNDTTQITLSPRQSNKLGVVHCAVGGDGLVVVAGDVREIEDGAVIEIQRSKVRVERKGEEYIFTMIST